MLKSQLHHSFIRQFTKTWNNFFTYLVQTKIWKLSCIFDLSSWNNWNSFEVLSLDNILYMDIISKMQNIIFGENCYMQPYIFFMTAICNETTTRKNFILNSWTLSNFPALEIKKLVSVGEMLWRFDIVLHIWLYLYLFC